jgi:hypothetical protein
LRRTIAWRRDLDSYFSVLLDLAHLALCAAATLARPSGLIVPRFRAGAVCGKIPFKGTVLPFNNARAFERRSISTSITCTICAVFNGVSCQQDTRSPRSQGSPGATAADFWTRSTSDCLKRLLLPKNGTHYRKIASVAHGLRAPLLLASSWRRQLFLRVCASILGFLFSRTVLFGLVRQFFGYLLFCVSLRFFIPAHR